MRLIDWTIQPNPQRWDFTFTWRGSNFTPCNQPSGSRSRPPLRSRLTRAGRSRPAWRKWTRARAPDGRASTSLRADRWASAWTSRRAATTANCSTRVSIANFDKWYATFQAAGASLNGALVEVGEWLSSIAITPRWTGNVVDASFEGANVECRVENILGTRHKLVPGAGAVGGRVTQPQRDLRRRGRAAGGRLRLRSDTSEPVHLEELLHGSVPGEGGQHGHRPRSVLRDRRLDQHDRDRGRRGPRSAVHRNRLWLDTIWYIQVSPNGNHRVRRNRLWPWIGADAQITPFSTSAITTTTLDGSSTKSYSFSITTPWDTLPTTASGVKFCAQTTSAVLTVADEGDRLQRHGDREREHLDDCFCPGFHVRHRDGGHFGGISERRELQERPVRPPSNNYGVSALSDGLCASAGATISIFDNSGVVVFIEYDIFCRGRIDTYDIPQAAIDGASDVYLMAAFDASAAKDPLYPIYGQVIAYGWDGTVETVAISATYPVSGLSKSFNEITSGVVNTYSNSILPDGTGGYFSAYALKMPAFAKPLAAYEYIRFGVAMRTKATTSSTGIFFPNQAVWTNGSNTITGPINPAVGSWIRPASPFDTTNQEYMGTRFIDPVTGFHGGLPEDWRQVSSSTPTGGGNYSVVFFWRGVGGSDGPL